MYKEFAAIPCISFLLSTSLPKDQIPVQRAVDENVEIYMSEGLKMKFPIIKGNDGFFSHIEIKLEGKK